jgi:hypothetical protein
MVVDTTNQSDIATNGIGTMMAPQPNHTVTGQREICHATDI